MSKPSLKQLNAEFAQHHMELVKGNGYFYFMDLDSSPDGAVVYLDIPSIYVCHFNHMPVSRWRAEMAQAAAKIEAWRAEQ